MKQIKANLLKIESTTTTENFPGDITGPSIIATASASGEKGETAQVFSSGGIISNPAKGTIGLRISKGSLDIVVASMNYKIPLPENQGEAYLFSTDEEGNLLSKLYLDEEGNFIFNDGSDFAVRYSALETAYNEVNGKLNDLITAYNAHIHVTTATVGLPPPTGSIGVISPTVSTAVPSTGDITPSKIEEIFVP